MSHLVECKAENYEKQRFVKSSRIKENIAFLKCCVSFSVQYILNFNRCLLLLHYDDGTLSKDLVIFSY